MAIESVPPATIRRRSSKYSYGDISANSLRGTKPGYWEISHRLPNSFLSSRNSAPGYFVRATTLAESISTQCSPCAEPGPTKTTVFPLTSSRNKCSASLYLSLPLTKFSTTLPSKITMIPETNLKLLALKHWLQKESFWQNPTQDVRDVLQRRDLAR